MVTKSKKTKKKVVAKPKIKKAKVAFIAKPGSPKVLIYDIETAPLLGSVWALFDQNVGLNQIAKDWHVLSWSAKWLDAPENEVMYMDQRDKKNIEDDFSILQGIWKLLDEADIVITQNGKKFDNKKLNARFILSGMQPPSSYRNIDTLEIAKRHFAFTSNKLEYMTDKLCVKYKKQVNHGQFQGFNLWKECLAGNLEAWKEMEHYNKYDVLSLEELYKILIVWDNRINFNVYNEGLVNFCKCGSSDFIKNGFAHSNTAKFQKFKCKKCGSEVRSKENLLPKEKRQSLTRPATPSKSE